MQRILVVIALIVITGFSVQAQKLVKFNPKVAFNVNWLSDTPGNASDRGVSIGSGGGIDFRIGKRIYALPGFHYKWLGSNITSTSGALEREGTIRYHGFRMPVDLGLNIIQKEIFKLRIMAGVDYFVILKIDSDDLQLNKEDFKNGVFGYNAGVGVDLKFFTIDMLYYGSVTEIFEAFTDPKNNTFEFMVGFVF